MFRLQPQQAGSPPCLHEQVQEQTFQVSAVDIRYGVLKYLPNSGHILQSPKALRAHYAINPPILQVRRPCRRNAPSNRTHLAKSDRTAALQPRLLTLLLLLFFTCITSLASAQEYTSVVIFGDSMSDTQPHVVTVFSPTLPTDCSTPRSATQTVEEGTMHIAGIQPS